MNFMKIWKNNTTTETKKKFLKKIVIVRMGVL